MTGIEIFAICFLMLVLGLGLGVCKWRKRYLRGKYGISNTN